MNSKVARKMSWRLRFKLAAVVLLGAAALLMSPPQTASASACPHRICLRDVSVAGCCGALMTGADTSGPCRVLRRCAKSS